MPTHPILDFDGEPDFSASKVAMQRNSFKCRNAAEQSRYVFHNSLETLRPKLGDHDFAWRSHATNFARGGIYHAGKNYMRDPRSGVWFNSQKVQTPGMSRTKPEPCHYMENSFDRPGFGSQGPGTGVSFRSTLGGPFKRTGSEPSLRPPSSSGMHHRHTLRPDVLRGSCVTLRSP
uniref:Uncharacterized protein n=1 Tax=Alexandrium monilatum TaxID=311494 RepID=A0A6T1JZ63_9DINO|mmetsp:Transcript_15696/g.47063  ORF Transcript_15696/g.47063 Transcript_15696/m.47063 type:complete len:175 (-) Transcript_15696:69-593(-)